MTFCQIVQTTLQRGVALGMADDRHHAGIDRPGFGGRGEDVWEFRLRPGVLFHDGGTTDRAVAIQRHAGGAAGQGTAAANAFNALNSGQKTDLVNFLGTL